MKAAVIGHPILQSKSPLIHRTWMKAHNIPGTFEALDVPPDQLRQVVHRLKDEGYRGASITIPHKETVMDLCDRCDLAAQAIGAVNCLAFDNGKILGRNTDAYGFLENLKTHDSSRRWAQDHALVLGAGGAARAVLYALSEMGVSDVKISNRTQVRAEQVAKQFGVHVVPWDQKESALSDVTILINTTQLGMKGQPALGLDLTALSKDALVTDIVYAPLMTPLLVAAQKKGCTVVTGIGMLAHQAVPAFESWFHVRPTVTPDLLQALAA